MYVCVDSLCPTSVTIRLHGKTKALPSCPPVAQASSDDVFFCFRFVRYQFRERPQLLGINKVPSGESGPIVKDQ